MRPKALSFGEAFLEQIGSKNHSRFYGKRKMLWFNAPRPTQWLREMVDHLERLGACCFWYALLGVTRDKAAFELAVDIGIRLSGEGLSAGITYNRAVWLLAQSGCNSTVYQVDVTVASELSLIQRSKQPGRDPPHGVVLVPVNDEFEAEPHWLPTMRFRNYPIQIPPALARIINPGVVLAANVDDIQPNVDPFVGPMHVNGLAEEFVNYQGTFLDPPEEDELFPGLFEQHQETDAQPGPSGLDGLALLKGASRIVGVIPPIFPLSNRLNPLAPVFHRISEVGVPLLDAGDMTIVEGFPTAVQRGLSRLTGEGIMAWQLRPSVIANMHVSSRHFVYVCMSPPTLLDPKVMESGDLNPDFVGRLVTETGAFVLVDPFEVSLPSTSSYTTLRVFRLSRSGITISGALFRAMPFHLEKVTGVTTTAWHVMLVRNRRECFPTQRAFVRAQFSVLAMAAPEELRPLIVDQRNEALSLIAEGKLADDFDPVRLVLALHEQLHGMRRLMSVSGRAHHSA